MPTMDFEAYLPSDAVASERAKALGQLLAMEDAGGIHYVVTFPLPIARPDNEAMVETCKHEPRVLLGCQVNPNHGQEAVADLERCVTRWGMRILKLYPPCLPLFNPKTLALMDKARELGIIVNIHSGRGDSQPFIVGALAGRYPEVPIIMDHMGYRSWTADAVLVAQDNPNVYLGTTVASFEPGRILEAMKVLGPERIIFGSNAPLLYVDLAVEAIRRARFGKEAEQLIFGGNLARLYHID